MKIEEKIIDDIAKGGWTIINVLPEEKELPYSYTIGLYKSFKHPEIVLSGIKSGVADTILNNIGDKIKTGKSYSTGKEYDDILNGYNCVFKILSKGAKQKHFGKAEWLYSNNDYKMYQLILPDKNYKYPWDEGYSFINQRTFYEKTL